MKGFWKHTPFAHLVKEVKGEDGLGFFLWMKSKLTKSKFEDMAIHGWAAWKERQRCIHGESKMRMPEHITWSVALLTDFRRTRTRSEGPMVGNRHQEVHWIPPTPGRFKLNVDASVNEATNRYSMGGVLRDHQGRLLLAFGKHITQSLSVVHGELLAILEGVKLVYESNYRSIQATSDSLLAVQAVTADEENLGYTGLCAEEIKERIRNFIEFDIAHVRSLENSVAYSLAVFSSSSQSSFVWRNEKFSSWLVRLVIDDYN
ncbi:uncharacterized protein [Henckelia pumila]|uniref:uncharacterized protein n=1 Tax=Henckelia pumila TaxID=405737 RepID=UPI003C6E7DD2